MTSPQSLDQPHQNRLSVATLATSEHHPNPFRSLPFEEAAQEAKDILVSIIAEIDQELKNLKKMREELDTPGNAESDQVAEEDDDCEEEDYYPQSQCDGGQISSLYELFADRPEENRQHGWYND